MLLRLSLIILLALVASTSIAAKDWRGIVPMQSTRADVEARLGRSSPPPNDVAYGFDKGRAIYSLTEGDVYIRFADAEFLKVSGCSAVPLGTVVLIQFTPKEMLLSSLQLDEKAFRKFDPLSPISNMPAEHRYEGFINEKEGLVIRAHEGKVQQMVYFASSADRGRCAGVFEAPEDFVKMTVTCTAGSDYGDIRFSDEKRRLDHYAIQLLNDKYAQGYIIVYGGTKDTAATATSRANRARDYLITVKKIDPAKIKAVYGGHRVELTVYPHIVPVWSIPPPLMSF